MKNACVIVVLFASVIAGRPAAAATLKVSSFPSGAQVSVDGVTTGKVTPMNITVTEGDHTVTVQIPGSGWNPDTRVVTIVMGNNDLSVTLLPTPIPGPPGPKGDTGVTGVTGLQGPVGPQGPAATRAAPACSDNTHRYVDCLNGTVTDTLTGLIWLKDANCFPAQTYAAANQSATGLSGGQCGLTDGSSPGDWRLPTTLEWQATIEQGDLLGRCGLTNDFGTGCLYVGSTSSFTGINFFEPSPAGTGSRDAAYWSSTTMHYVPSRAWSVTVENGFFQGVPPAGLDDRTNKSTSLNFVWPVRGGK